MVGIDTHTGTRLARQCIISSDIDTYNHIVHGADYGLLHRIERIVQCLHDGVLLAAVLDELVPAELGGIVLADLTFYLHVADTGIRRYQVNVPLGISQIFLYIIRKPELCVKLQHI